MYSAVGVLMASWWRCSEEDLLKFNFLDASDISHDSGPTFQPIIPAFPVCTMLMSLTSYELHFGFCEYHV